MRRSALVAQLVISAGIVVAAIFAPVPVWIWAPVICVAGLWTGHLVYKLIHFRPRRTADATVIGGMTYYNLPEAEMIPWVPGTPPPVLWQTEDAEDRALALFERLLTPQQLIEWRLSKTVHVPLANGRYAVIGPTHLITWPVCESEQCVHPISTRDTGILPNADTLVAQLLWLRNHPNALRKIGHRPPLPGVPEAVVEHAPSGYPPHLIPQRF